MKITRKNLKILIENFLNEETDIKTVKTKKIYGYTYELNLVDKSIKIVAPSTNSVGAVILDPSGEEYKKASKKEKSKADKNYKPIKDQILKFQPEFKQHFEATPATSEKPAADFKDPDAAKRYFNEFIKIFFKELKAFNDVVNSILVYKISRSYTGDYSPGFDPGGGGTKEQNRAAAKKYIAKTRKKYNNFKPIKDAILAADGEDMSVFSHRDFYRYAHTPQAIEKIIERAENQEYDPSIGLSKNIKDIKEKSVALFYKRAPYFTSSFGFNNNKLESALEDARTAFKGLTKDFSSSGVKKFQSNITKSAGKFRAEYRKIVNSAKLSNELKKDYFQSVSDHISTADVGFEAGNLTDIPEETGQDISQVIDNLFGKLKLHGAPD